MVSTNVSESHPSPIHLSRIQQGRGPVPLRPFLVLCLFFLVISWCLPFAFFLVVLFFACGPFFFSFRLFGSYFCVVVSFGRFLSFVGVLSVDCCG